MTVFSWRMAASVFFYFLFVLVKLFLPSSWFAPTDTAHAVQVLKTNLNVAPFWHLTTQPRSVSVEGAGEEGKCPWFPVVRCTWCYEGAALHPEAQNTAFSAGRDETREMSCSRSWTNCRHRSAVNVNKRYHRHANTNSICRCSHILYFSCFGMLWFTSMNATIHPKCLVLYPALYSSDLTVNMV